VYELLPVVFEVRQSLPETAVELVRILVLVTVQIVAMDMRRAVGSIDDRYLRVFLRIRVIVVENSDEIVRLIETR
jgi:hypothetical protein